MKNRGKKDSEILSFEQHELQSMADKWGVKHWSFIAAIKGKLKTNDPNYIEEAISEMKANGDDLVISHEDMFGTKNLGGNMKKVIYKFNIDIYDFQTIDVNARARVISAKEQTQGLITIWVLTDLDARKIRKNIQIIGTGNKIEYNVSEQDWDFVDTVITNNGLVWHVFSDKM